MDGPVRLTFRESEAVQVLGIVMRQFLMITHIDFPSSYAMLFIDMVSRFNT